ncbi:MAG: CHASE2 domain-containing protein [Calditrichaceae bacterium]|nr:CHASE2 domain-containing protein [Calditrichaceae bacterium]MBN2707733.1 CHASE2 domain-containing protein [Calditrichaceae bacterium]RQV96452.1 MAG: CHASE2 domain-containing protein [Calditrichota bacterium]
MELTKPKASLWVTVGILVSAILLAVILSAIPVFETLELKLLDFRFDIRGPISVENSPIVIVAIDDQSDMSTPDRWPWPRYYYAHIVENLLEAGAAVVGIDVIFDQTDSYNPQSDSLLAAALANNDNVVIIGKIERISDKVENFIPPHPLFSNAADWGLAGVESDEDGFYRRYLIGGEMYRDSLYNSFAGEVLRKYLKSEHLQTYRPENENFEIGDYRIPKYDASSMLINFSGPAKTFTYYSFDQVVDDEDFDLRDEFDLDSFDSPGMPELDIPPGLKYSGLLKEKIVLIGSTMQELHDNFPTPFLEYKTPDGDLVKAEMPGVEIHANAIQTILTQNYLKTPPGYVLYIFLVLCAVIVYLITRWLHAGWGGALTILFLAGYFVLVFLAFINLNMIFEFTSPALTIVFSFIGITLHNYLLTQKEKKVIRGAFAHYVPEKVVQEIINNPDKLSLGGEERVVTVMFSDVAGFTSISEMMTPRNLVQLLNEYLTAMTDIIIAHNGIIDKYEGDAIMAEFGVPVHYPNHAYMGCKAALKMQKELNRLRRQWLDQGKPDIQARIGLNTGEVIVGNMGSRDVFDYTVMGDHVNLGARLESANKSYGTKIMISEFTHEFIKNDFYTRPLDLIRVKGKQKPVEVFELMAEKSEEIAPAVKEQIDFYVAGMNAYRQREWDKAIDYFEQCLNLLPDDQPAQIYRTRCIEFRFNEPPADWDGVITMREK